MSEHLATVMEEHGEYCLRVAYLYVRDWAMAEEIVQDVFLAYYHQQERFEQRASLKTYLVKITVHKSHDYLRSWKNKRHLLLEKFHIGVSKRTPEKALVEIDERKTLTNVLFQIPILYREVVILYYYQELKIREIADILRSTENTVKTRLHRARKMLYELLDEHEWEVLEDDSF